MLDHLVYATPDLPVTLDWFATNTGLRPRTGGTHPSRGTRNALLNLGNGAYLEILATDPGNTTVTGPRWMGVDALDRPRLTRWCVRTPDLTAAATRLTGYHPALGERGAGSRRTPAGELLRWEMLLPRPDPVVEIAPFCIDWSASARHPTEGMPAELSLLELRLYHPEPGRLQPLIDALHPGLTVHRAERPLLAATLDTPQGRVMI